MKNWLVIAMSCSLASAVHGQSGQQVEEKIAEKAAEKKVVAGVSPIAGQWRGVKGFEGFEKMPAKEVSKICMQYQAQQVTFSMDGDIKVAMCRYEPNNRMVLFMREGKNMLKIPAVYKLDGDKLTVCHYKDFENAPDKFPNSTEPGAGLYVVELKRVALEKGLEGKWQADNFSVNGEQEPNKAIIHFEKGIMSVKIGNDEEVVMPFLTDTSKDPKRLLTSDNGDLTQCIYKFEDGKLVLSLLDKSEDYPKDFKTGKGAVVFKLKKMETKKP